MAAGAELLTPLHVEHQLQAYVRSSAVWECQKNDTTEIIKIRQVWQDWNWKMAAPSNAARRQQLAAGERRVPQPSCEVCVVGSRSGRLLVLQHRVMSSAQG